MPATADSIPRAVLVFSGKRKSGKDYITDIIHARLEGLSEIMRLSGPLKAQYAKEHGLDFSKLLDASEYKENYRRDMIRWGEEKRAADPSFFCRAATADAKTPVWIISDARRPTDVEYFKKNFGDVCVCVRVEASVATRTARGFVHTPGIDDADSECALDTWPKWDVVIRNDAEAPAELEKGIGALLTRISSMLQVGLDLNSSL